MTQCKPCIKVEVLMCIYNFSASNGWTLCGETPLDVLVAEIDRRQSHQWSPVWLRNPVRLSVCLLWILRFCVSTAKRWKSGRSCWCLPNCWCRHAHSTASFICPPPLQEQSVAQKHFDTHVRAPTAQWGSCATDQFLLIYRFKPVALKEIWRVRGSESALFKPSSTKKKLIFTEVQGYFLIL